MIGGWSFLGDSDSDSSQSFHESERCESYDDYCIPAPRIAACSHLPHTGTTGVTSEWHYVSGAYVVVIFALGLLLVVSIFCGAADSRSNQRKTKPMRRKRYDPEELRRQRENDSKLKISADASGCAREEEVKTTKRSATPASTSNSVNVVADHSRGLSTSLQHTSSSVITALFPKTATKSEVARFVRARKGDLEAAAEQLHNYTSWREQHKEIEYQLMKEPSMQRRSGERQSDYDWRMASNIAQRSDACDDQSLLVALPCVVYIDSDESASDGAQNGTVPALRSLDGSRICHHLPARIDTHLAHGQIYALALALYLDRRLSRNTEEKFTVVIDTRPGEGFANISALHLVPFIRHTSHLLNVLHPERLHRACVFPVPSVCSFIWNRLIRPFMDPVTAEKICVLGGSAKVDSKLPKGMKKYISAAVLEELERRRVALFRKGYS